MTVTYRNGVPQHISLQGVLSMPRRNPPTPQPPPPPSPPSRGVGTQVKKLLAQVWVMKNCDACNKFARQMDEWGIEACRTTHREAILRRLGKENNKRNWLQKLVTATAGATGMLTGAMAWLDPRRPIESMLDEAIRLAEVEEAEFQDKVKEQEKQNEQHNG